MTKTRKKKNQGVNNIIATTLTEFMNDLVIYVTCSYLYNMIYHYVRIGKSIKFHNSTVIEPNKHVKASVHKKCNVGYLVSTYLGIT